MIKNKIKKLEEELVSNYYINSYKLEGNNEY